jgi:hypothetical protein
MKRNIIYLFFLLGLFGCSDSIEGELIYVEPDGHGSFNFPYFLYIPEQIAQGESVHIIVETNNSGFADDDFQKHLDKAKRTATLDYYIGNYVAQNLRIPLLVPVFPRSKEDWKTYTHALDRDVMLQKGNTLERIDIQLIEMFKDARLRLKKKNIDTEEKFLMTGFSASGTFANRFTLIHPERISAVAAGGMNGLLMLPLDSLNGTELKYPLGTGDFNELVNKEFDKFLYVKTPQFYFMGDLDDNDAVPYDDAFDQNEREIINTLLGKEMLTKRWTNCRKIYSDNNVNAVIKTLENAGHEHPETIKKEIVEFFRMHIKKQNSHE